MARAKKYEEGGYMGTTPEDVADMKMRERARRAYDKAMPEPDTTFGNLKKQMPKRDVPPMQNLPDTPASKRAVPPMQNPQDTTASGMSLKDLFNRKAKPRKDDGMVPLKSGGSVSSASKRADGCATKGKTKGRMI